MTIEEKVTYTITVNKEASQEIEQLVNYLNVESKYEYNEGNLTTAEDIIKAGLYKYLTIYNATKDIKSIAGYLANPGRDFTLKNRFDEVRKQKKMSQANIQRETGISKSNLSEILKNNHQPSLENFLKIWFVLGCPPLVEVLYLEKNNRYIKRDS
ncbi:helix-turn-helix domain-containing protein [Ferdinandcohnia sp. SAFN-114]|uniref:helix-turn-helix domain-containing protein n=1 Tax=Ferdinandcohnia sp. SAFN-114 TaxID=3387275 RepID=UPI003F82010A